jgi:hypothetical protein
MVTRELAARTSLTVPEALAAGPPGGEAVAGSEAPGAAGAAPGSGSLFCAELFAYICD